MIGVFDSGYGGLTIFRKLTQAFPEYSFAYLGDNARAPYGNKTPEEITEYTKQGVGELFRRGCVLVVLGCNTASAVSLRELQQKWLPTTWPDNKLLGIVVPTIEQITSTTFQMNVGILGTNRTVESHAYQHEIQKRNPNITVIEHACSGLAGIVELLGSKNTQVVQEVSTCVQGLVDRGAVDAVLLACTHYELIADSIAQALPAGTALYHQPSIVAESLRDYLRRHPEIDSQLEKTGKRTYLTTGHPQEVSQKSTDFIGETIEFQAL
ncbi:MAG: glutamate racemase [bacterium]|nr:glutamate racemase [bacterium]